MSTLTPQIEATPVVKPMSASRRFHLFMASACSVLLIIDVVGCWYTSIHIAGVGMHAVAVLLLTAMVLPVAAYGHEKGKIALRDAALTIPWAFLLFELLAFPVLIGARLRMPLRDAFLAHGDRLLGVSVPGIVAWAHRHWMGPVLAHIYYLLIPLLLAAVFAPALAGKVRHAQEFIVANTVAFAAGLPIFTLFPAVGPWYFHGFQADFAQNACQRQLLALRLPGSYSYLSQGSGIVCFPSFHVVWAVLCAAALWGFKPLRVPVAVFSALIIVSTLTTGWHYFVDVLGGLVLAAASLAFARFFLRDHCVRDIGEDTKLP